MVTTTAQAIQGKMYNIRPAYTNAEAYDYVPVRGSELEKLSIGLRKNWIAARNMSIEKENEVRWERIVLYI